MPGLHSMRGRAASADDPGSWSCLTREAEPWGGPFRWRNTLPDSCFTRCAKRDSCRDSQQTLTCLGVGNWWSSTMTGEEGSSSRAILSKHCTSDFGTCPMRSGGCWPRSGTPARDAARTRAPPRSRVRLKDSSSPHRALRCARPPTLLGPAAEGEGTRPFGQSPAPHRCRRHQCRRWGRPWRRRRNWRVCVATEGAIPKRRRCPRGVHAGGTCRFVTRSEDSELRTASP